MSDTSTNATAEQAYDAAKSSPARSQFLAFPANSRRELTPWTRREIIRKSRALEANCPFLTRIAQKIARMSIGAGIHIRFNTPDARWNDEAKRDIEMWWNNAGAYSIDASVNGWDAKRVAVERMVINGEFSLAMVNGANDWPMIQPLDPFEIESPESAVSKDWVDGVRVNAFERPIEYSVRTLPRLLGDYTRDYRYVPAESMIHIFRRRATHDTRGMPWLYSGINQGIDALDLNALITGTAKLHSALAVAVKGTAKRRKKGAIAAIKNRDGETGNGEDLEALEKVFGGGMITYLGDQGEMQLLSSQYPGESKMQFMKLLLHQMCMGADLPFSVMWDMSLGGGTAVRYDAEDAQSKFDLVADKIIWEWVRREVIWKIAKSIKSGRLAKPADPYWFEKILFQGPRKITVDIGRMANAFKVLTRNGGMSTPRWFEEQGLNANDEMKAHIDFIKATQDYAESQGVPFELIFEPTPGAAQPDQQGDTPPAKKPATNDE